MSPRLAVFLAVASLSSFAETLEAPKLTDAEKKKLDAGEMVLHDKKPTDNKGVAAISMGVIDATTAEVWPIVKECQHFSKFMPRTKKSELIEENGEKLCAVELQMPWPIINLTAVSRSALTEQGSMYRREWSLVRGTYHRNQGSWLLVPWGDEGKKTLVVYTIDSDPAVIIPDGILRAAQTGSLPEVFKSIRKRAELLRGSAKN
ncbi:MAG: SRPBCC family protein [Archangium sp.]